VTVHIVSTNRDLPATITRRAPSADPGTRTVHFEIDLDDADRRIPVDTTGEVHVPFGQPVPATQVPLSAVTMNDQKATFFAVEGDVAHARTLVELGEIGAHLFFKLEALAPGTPIVVEGRALLKDGDRVSATSAPAAPTGAASSVTSGGHGTESGQ
jgi:multidrug efflux pump subunit AcrA (membrane-fusion protein)